MSINEILHFFHKTDANYVLCEYMCLDRKVMVAGGSRKLFETKLKRFPELDRDRHTRVVKLTKCNISEYVANKSCIRI
ncbi:hypothetical protein GCM10011318_00020 [Phaeocystidibacter marisrubri]|nr:hypothetical protein GCM10011318_00020 [Phaeocystidibacter marisrubri]